MSLSFATIQELKKSFDAALILAGDKAGLEEVEKVYLSRKGKLALLLKQVGSISPAERGKFGSALNALKKGMNSAVQEKKQTLSGTAKPFFDLSEPAVSQKIGHLHPYTLVRDEVSDIFHSMGFEVADGEEVTSDYYSFESLNMPASHPARDAWDTFYLTQKNKKGEKLVMRPHTSSMQVKIMEERKPPLRIAVIGRCYRHEATDASHEHSLNQIEGFVVDEKISVSNLVSTLQQLLSGVFGAAVEIRLRPSFFPFVEPGYEVDFRCLNCGGKGCRVCKQSGWVELLGCGMIHPKVFEAAKYPKNKYTGFAFGFGFDRLVMMKFKVPDIRLFNSGDLRFVRQF